jgi:hypothetical protein
MKPQLAAFLIGTCVAAFPLRAQEAAEHSYVPPSGFVPDSATAVAIAVAVWIPIYGRDQIRTEAPYGAQLKADRWVVTGSLPPNTIGGVALAEIAKSDGRILRVSHGR